MLSRAHKTIFVHIPKTAGQSVVAPFLDHLGLGWDAGESLLLRAGDGPGMPERLAHLYAREYVELGFVTQAEFDDYLKFAVIRHPYERAVSEFRYRMGKWGRRLQWSHWLTSRDFDSFMREDYPDTFGDNARHMCPQVAFVYDDKGKLMVDHLAEHARLDKEMAPIYRLAIGDGVAVPVRNVSPDAPGFSVNVLSQSQKDAIYRRFQDDFEAFGYRR
ncbi:sulfotransferase family 2 domain-containing protein [Shimia sp.]|uniref:sulfotransferase family 2 domain-containing protein n=1 Tax=Shimia sp. TaxID=1954381 RepID=UPI00329944A4